MELIDTHTHLYLPEFDDDRKEMMQRALDNNVTGFLLPNIDSNSIEQMHNMAATYDQQCFPMMGLHPCSVNEHSETELKIVENYLFNSERKFYGVGEIGLDYYWDKTFVDQQKEAFRLQILWAKELRLPLSIHSREATDDCISFITVLHDETLTGVFHCFSGDEAQAKKIVDLGFYLGIGGVVTFKNSGLDKALENIPIECMVLETDAPYLAPVPHRGKRNESSYIALVAQKIAAIKNTTTEDVARITTENARRIFKI